MLTRQGIVSLVAGILAIAVGRIFGVLELFIIGSAFIAAVLVAVVFVRMRRPRLVASRWVHPSVLVAGDAGRVDLRLEHRGSMRSTSFELVERVSRRGDIPGHVARLPVAPLDRSTQSTVGYQLPTTTRGIIALGPLLSETRDPLGIARTTRVVADVDTVTVAPRTILLEMPQLGQGILGRHLLTQAKRMGPGEFHGLREYVDGDEPRSIDWKASARSENLLVKEHTVEGVRRCSVVFDASPDSYLDSASFERAVTAAASLVHSASLAGLTTRFVTAGGIDLRGPEVAVTTLRVLAEVEPDRTPLGVLDRDPGEGLGLLIIVSGSRSGAGWQAAQSVIDPTLTAIAVTTDEPSRSSMGVSARTEDEFADNWRAMNGTNRRRPSAPDPSRHSRVPA